MTYANLGGGRLIGVSSDTKPTTFPVGTTFYETNTYLTFVWNGNIWILSPNQPFVSTKKYGAYYARGASTVADGLLTGLLNSFGTHTLGLDATGLFDHCDTSATINTTAGLRFTRTSARALNVYFKYKFKLTQITNTRFFAGVSNTNANPTTTTDYLNAVGGIGIWFDDGVSANWKIMHDSGAGASTQDNTSIAANTNAHVFEVQAIDATPKFQVILDGVVLTDVTSALPATTTNLGLSVYIENTAAAQKFFDLYYIEIYQDG